MSQSTRASPTPPSRLDIEADPQLLQRIVALLNAVVGECRISLREDGLHASAVDPAGAASVDLRVGASAFHSFEVSEGVIGLDLERFGEIVGMADREQVLTLSLDATMATLEIESGSLGYTYGLVDPAVIREPQDHSAFDIAFTGGIRTEIESLARGIRVADMLATHLVVGTETGGRGFYMEAEGDTDRMSIAMSPDELLEVSPGEAQSLFSIEYLKAIQRAIPPETVIDLELGTDAPLAIRLEEVDGVEAVEYLVSPRISVH